MARTAYPNGDDLQRYLAAAGLFPNPLDSSVLGLLDLDGAANGGAAEIERACGRKFLAVQASRTFWVNSGALVELGDLRGTVVVTFDGVTLTVPTGYRLLPEGADQFGDSWKLLRLAESAVSVLDSSVHTLVVSGKWGVADAIPEDVWQAILACAARTVAPLIGAQRSGGLVSLRQGDVEQKFAGSDGFALGGLVSGWDAAVDRCVRRWRRVAC